VKAPVRAKRQGKRTRDDEIVRVMLYLPYRVKRVIDEMAFADECKAHDHYLAAIESYLRSRGKGREADLLLR
jgi:hypothetical protein